MQRAVVEGIDLASKSIRVLINQQLHAAFLSHPVSHRVHFLELPSGVHMEQREGWGCRIKCLAGQMQHHCGIFPDGIEHHGPFGFCNNFTQDVNAFGLKALEMG